MKPIGRARPSAASSTSSATSAGAGCILMADDDPTVAAYVRKVLLSARYHIEVANNGGECLHILRTQPNGFDLPLLDLMMPEVSGYDVLREITLSGSHAEPPVLVLTNFPRPATTRNAGCSSRAWSWTSSRSRRSTRIRGCCRTCSTGTCRWRARTDVRTGRPHDARGRGRDDPHNAVLFRKLLEKRLGFSVLVTESPEELFGPRAPATWRFVVMDVSLAHSTLDGGR